MGTVKFVGPGPKPYDVHGGSEKVKSEISLSLLLLWGFIPQDFFKCSSRICFVLLESTKPGCSTTDSKIRRKTAFVVPELEVMKQFTGCLYILFGL